MSSSLPPLVQACSGALASASANAISYPLDLVAIKVQTTKNPRLRDLRGAIHILRHILRKQGLPGLYDGLATDTASTVLSNFLYFYCYTVLHALAARRRAHVPHVPFHKALRQALTLSTSPILLGVPTELAVGFIAGVASRAISTPLGVLTVRLQSGEDDTDETGDEAEAGDADKQSKAKRMRDGLMAVIRDIYTEQGIRGFWAGFAPTLPLALTPALTLLFFQQLHRARVPPLPPSARAFLEGACANAAALALLYPLVLAKARAQAGRGAMMGEGGLGRLYDGVGAQLVKGFVSQGVTMMVKQRIEQAVVRMWMRAQAR